MGGHIEPATFATIASNSTMTRTIRMALAGNAVTGVDIAPPFDDKPDRVPLTEKDEQNIVDPVGAFVFPARPIPGRPRPRPATARFRCSTAIPVSTLP